MKAINEPNQVIIEQATNWVVLIDDSVLTQQQRKELANWLLKSPVHVEEFLQVSAIFDAIGEVAICEKVSIQELLNISQKNVVELEPNYIEINHPKRSVNKFWPAIAAILLVSIINIYIAWDFTDTSSVKYTTVVGEQRSVSLVDGTTVFLNTKTDISVNYTNRFRNIELNEGEAVFKVAHNPLQPFRVWVGDIMFQALGTEFNVKTNRGNVELTVISGEVALTNKLALGNLAELSENSTILISDDEFDISLSDTLIVTIGQGASILSDGKITTINNADLIKKLSWKSRKLVFKNDSLQDVIHEFNKYNTVQIYLSCNTISQLLITGVFDANDPMSLLKFIESSGKARIQNRDKSKIVNC
jgi:transmembrane sensor